MIPSILRTFPARVLPWLKVPALLLGVGTLWLSSVALIFLTLEGAYLVAIPRWWEFNSDTKVATDFYLGMMVVGPIMFVMAFALSCPLTAYLCWFIARRMRPAPTVEDPVPSFHPLSSLHAEAPAPARDETR